MKMKVVLLTAVIGLSAFGSTNVYAIPSFLQKKVSKECEVSREELRRSNEEYRRCMQRIGGREIIKDTQCKETLIKKEASTENYERCEFQVLGKSLQASSSKS
jgi:hypothetical protein